MHPSVALMLPHLQAISRPASACTPRRALSQKTRLGPHRRPRASHADAALLHDAAAAVRALVGSGVGEGSLSDEAIAGLTLLGRELQLDCVREASFNAGEFTALALHGRLRAAVAAPDLCLSSLSWGLFSEPSGPVTLAGSRILKGEAAGAADAYAVVTRFSLTSLDEPPGAPPLTGTNTVAGTFKLRGDPGAPPDEILVAFDTVRLEFDANDDDVPHLQERRLPSPACVTLRVLLMTPDLSVTQSSVGSIAVLQRCE